MILIICLLTIIVGFAVRLSAPLVVLISICMSAVVAGFSILHFLEVVGHGFRAYRYLLVFVLPLPVIGVLEKCGIREFIQNVAQKANLSSIRNALVSYVAFRMISSALGFYSLGGHVQMVRPILLPLVESLGRRAKYVRSTLMEQTTRATCAAAENIGSFFGQNIFSAFSSVLFMRGILHANGLDISAFDISIWAIPSGVFAFIIFFAHLSFIDRLLQKTPVLL